MGGISLAAYSKSYVSWGMVLRIVRCWCWMPVLPERIFDGYGFLLLVLDMVYALLLFFAYLFFSLRCAEFGHAGYYRRRVCEAPLLLMGNAMAGSAHAFTPQLCLRF